MADDVGVQQLELFRALLKALDEEQVGPAAAQLPVRLGARQLGQRRGDVVAKDGDGGVGRVPSVQDVRMCRHLGRLDQLPVEKLDLLACHLLHALLGAVLLLSL